MTSQNSDSCHQTTWNLSSKVIFRLLKAIKQSWLRLAKAQVVRWDRLLSGFHCVCVLQKQERQLTLSEKKNGDLVMNGLIFCPARPIQVILVKIKHISLKGPKNWLQKMQAWTEIQTLTFAMPMQCSRLLSYQLLNYLPLELLTGSYQLLTAA